MKHQKSIKINFIMNTILTMSSFIFPLITFPYISRVLLPVGTGKVSFATSIVTYFSLLAQLGIPTYGIRECAQVRDNKIQLTKIVQEIFIINLVMCFISYLLFFIALVTVPKMWNDRLLFLVISSSIFFNCIGMEWLYKGLEQYSYITIRSVIFKLIAILLMFLFVKQKSDYIIYGAISIFAASASNVFNFINLNRIIPLTSIHRISQYQFKRHWKPILIFFGMACATTVYTNLDTAMLGFMVSDEEVGYYNAAIKIKVILTSIVTSLGTVLLPRASYYIENRELDRFFSISRKSLQFVVLISVPLCIYFMLFAKQGILLLSGDKYLNSVIPMQIIMPTIIFIGITNILGIQMMIPLGKERKVLNSVIIGAVVDLIINVLLIPRLMSIGAALGTVIAEFAVLIYQYSYMKKSGYSRKIRINCWRIFVSVFIAGLCVSFFKFSSLSIFWGLAVSAIVYFTVYLVLIIILGEPLILELMHQMTDKLLRKLPVKS